MIYYDNDGLIIRGMIKDDIEKLVFGFKEQNWNKSYEQFEAYYNYHERKERVVLVAEFQGNIAGYLIISPYAESGPFADKNIPELIDFNVLIKFQKKGIGNKILDVAEELAKKNSRFISLSVGLHSGYGVAQRMYVKRGYIPDGTGAWYNGEQLGQYAKCENDDGLVLYFLKELD